MQINVIDTDTYELAETIDGDSIEGNTVYRQAGKGVSATTYEPRYKLIIIEDTTGDGL